MSWVTKSLTTPCVPLLSKFGEEEEGRTQDGKEAVRQKSNLPSV